MCFLIAVHFISELSKFELIITIFEHKYVYLSPTLRKNILIVNAVLSASLGGTWAMNTKIYKFHIVFPFLPIVQKGRTTVE